MIFIKKCNYHPISVNVWQNICFIGIHMLFAPLKVSITCNEIKDINIIYNK